MYKTRYGQDRVKPTSKKELQAALVVEKQNLKDVLKLIENSSIGSLSHLEIEAMRIEERRDRIEKQLEDFNGGNGG